MLFFVSVALISATILSFTGCGKYEDGPSLSLKTKKGRITNQWKLTAELYNGTPQSLISNEVIDIKKDDTFVITWGSSSETGTWAFSSDKESVTFTPNNSSSANTYKILRLKSNELWLQEIYGSSTYEYHYDKE